MRKLVSYSLFFLFTWQIIGFVGYFEFSHYRLKKEIKTLLKQGVPKDELVYFSFDQQQLKELVWLKKNEFDLNGNLFDVVRRRTSNGKTHMECISDKQETILFAHLEESVSMNLGDDHHQTPISNWMKILHFPIQISENPIEQSIINLDSLHEDVFGYLPNSSLKSVRIETPPPCLLV